MVGHMRHNKIFSVVFSILTIFMLMFSMIFPHSKASAEVMDREIYKMDWSYSNQLGKEIRTELIKTANGQIAYCLTHGLKSPNGEDLPEMGKTDDIVYRVLLNGYPQKSPSELGVSNWEEAHYATQLAIWNALGQLSISELQHHNGNVEKTAKAIIRAADQSQDTQEIYMNVVPTEEQKAELKGDFFETNLYTVETNAKQGTFKVQTNSAPKGIKIVNENGEVKDQLNIGEKFRIQIPKNTNSGKFNLKVISSLSKLQAITYKGTDKIQNATVLLERGEEKVSSDLSVNWESIGSLKIKKTGENNEALLGAVFEVSNLNNEKIGTLTTDKDGVATLSNLPIGTYTVKEVKAPQGHVLSENTQTIEVKTGEIATIEVKNESIKGNIEIKKLSNIGKILPGVEFTVFKEDGTAVTKVTTNKDGIAKVDGLTFGKYYFQESKALDGYILNTTKYPFEVKEHNKTLTFEVENEKIPSIKTTATDKTNGTKEMHTTKSVTIQDKVEYKDLQAGKEYTLKGKLMDKETNKPLLVGDKEVTAEATFKPKEANGSITLDFTFNASELQGKEVVVFEDLIKDGKVVTTHADINDKGQTVKFVKPEVKTTATNKADGSKELDATKSVTIQDKVEYTDLIVGKEYVVKGKLMDKATNKPLLIDAKEVTAESKFTAKEKNGSITLDFTFNASELQGKEVVVFEELYQDSVLVAIHSDIEDMDQTVKFKERKPEQPQPEKPQPEKPQPEQPQPEKPQPEQPKPEKPLPQTGGQENNMMKYVGLGLLATALAGIGYTVVTRRRKQDQN